ncbi:MAG: lamin tail domain-containing protein [Bacteroidota bacterium]
MKGQIKFIKNILCTALVFIGVGLKSQVFINEIMINPSGTSDGANMPNTAEWVEFYNGSASAVDMSCWFFSDGDFAVTFPSGTTIAAGGYYTVASAAGSGLTPNLNWASCGCTSGSSSEVGIFTNSVEQVILYNSSGTIMDAIIWSTGQLPDGITTSAIGSCSSQIVTFPTSGATYETVGSNSDGISKERSVDGGATWQSSSSSTFGTSNAMVLPIELLYFNANYNGKYVDLNWATATEINNDYFTIERSGDGLNFESLLKVKGAGNSTNQINYSVTDEEPINGISYYRLKQTDFDDNFSYSNIVSVTSKIEEEYKIYPNPNESGLL